MIRNLTPFMLCLTLISLAEIIAMHKFESGLLWVGYGMYRVFKLLIED